MSFLRRLIAILFSLLVLGGYGHQIYVHVSPAHEETAGHQHSESDEKGRCHDCTCQCSPVMVASFERMFAIQVPTCVGYVTSPGEIPPETVPVGIDHPPQLS